MTFLAQITSYRLYVAGKRNTETDWHKVIHLIDTDNNIKGIIVFLHDGQALGQLQEQQTGGIERVIYWMYDHDYSDVVDMLRNEKPVFLRYVGPNYAYLNTGAEPTGEFEPSSP